MISQFLRHLAFDDDSSRGNLIIEATKDSYDCSLQVSLKSVSQLLPRKTKSAVNFSLSLSILPNSSEMKSKKYKTKIFKDTTDYLFDLFDDQEQVDEHKYFFENVGDDQFLHIVVYDHSMTNTNKIFRGKYYCILWYLQDELFVIFFPGVYQLPIDRLSETESDKRIDGKFLTLPADVIQDNAIWDELICRKDTMASKFVKTIQNYVEEGRKPSIRT